MKKLLLAVTGVLCLVGFAQAQSVSLKINAGILENTVGTAVAPNGCLLQLIASPSGTFSAPTSTSFATGDNTVVASFAMNSNSGTAGFTVNAINSLTLSASLTAGESLLLRFYPSLTAAGMPTTPTLGTSYGQVRSNTVEFGGTTDPSETSWFVPAAGSTVDLDYVTMSAGGTYSNSSAYATGVVLVGVVPEPSSSVGFAIALLGLAAVRVWKRRAGTV